MLRCGVEFKAESRPFIERVASVTAAGRARVYDISVPGPECFYANGILVHNCIMWSRDNRCSIHEAGQVITADMVCGLHVFGKPMDTRPEHPDMDALKPRESGLILKPGGTSCDNCMFFTNKSRCAGLAGTPKVHPKGCCARWSGRGAETIGY